MRFFFLGVNMKISKRLEAKINKTNGSIVRWFSVVHQKAKGVWFESKYKMKKKQRNNLTNMGYDSASAILFFN